MNMPAWFWEMTMSDWLMVVFGVLVLWFIIDYGFGSPWWEHPIGIIVLIYAISTGLLVFLIIFGMIAGQRVDEWARVPVTFALVIGIAGKIYVLHWERHRGRLERRAKHAAKRSPGA